MPRAKNSRKRQNLPPYVFRVRNAQGRDYYYFQRGRRSRNPGPRIRLPDDPQTAEFWLAYEKLNPQGVPEGRLAPVRGSFGELIEAYQASAEFARLRPKTRTGYARHLALVARLWGDLQVRGVRPAHVLRLRDFLAREKSPATADHVIASLSVAIGWGVPRDFCTSNPCREVRRLHQATGYPPWPWEDIEHFRTHAPHHLWIPAALALYTGQRQADVLQMRWSDLRGGVISLRQQKTGKTLEIPLHNDLRAILERVERRAVTIATTAAGRPWSSGFQASWRKCLARPEMARLRERGLVFHGLRKSAVCFLLEAGCTVAETAAITGQTHQMVEHYAAKVSQRRLAAAAILKWQNSG